MPLLLTPRPVVLSDRRAGPFARGCAGCGAVMSTRLAGWWELLRECEHVRVR